MLWASDAGGFGLWTIFLGGMIAEEEDIATAILQVARMKSIRVPSLGLLFRPCTAAPTVAPGLRAQARWAHKNALQAPQQPPAIPPTIPLVPDVETFLTVIGRGLRQHAPKFPTWDALFSLTSEQLRELGVEPPRARRYLLRWRQRFREGRYGIGGDLQHVENGVAELKVLEVVKDVMTRERHVVNVPAGKKIEDIPAKDLVKVRGFKVDRIRTIVGPYALPAKNGGARVAITEGMWEDRRGHKVDGGERRRAEVRFKRGVAERKALREKQGFY
ncbi:IGR protein motif-domain-containing protein [Bombardia bombarda]|uniref:Small ribosomal subunit protein mS41 n=1 Tax=Bombardia bombarda TaxID=252184 RepID=A0AA40CG86_9PEZI|nr:IGR protein motif-domain-containing protein [Bombardia bombarda]